MTQNKSDLRRRVSRDERLECLRSFGTYCYLLPARAHFRKTDRFSLGKRFTGRNRVWNRKQHVPLLSQRRNTLFYPTSVPEMSEK